MPYASFVMRKSRAPLARRASNLQPAAGFVLLEALVALLVFSLGVLGVVGLQASMTRAQTTAKFRADAAYLASESLGLMWADISNLDKYATDACESYVPCNDWKTKVATQLPSGTIAVTVDSASGDVTVAVGWTQPGGDVHQYLASTSVVAGKQGS